MIQPPVPTLSGTRAVFSGASDGDLRSDHEARLEFSSRLEIPEQWATVSQVHGAVVVEVDRPGGHGPADAVFTSTAGLPLAIFTADCAGVVVGAIGAVGVAHAGWRGAAEGVVAALVAAMRKAGHDPTTASIGPALGSCCLEVGPEVSARFEGFTTSTTWGSSSIDLVGAVEAQLEGLKVWRAERCTFHEDSWFSHRKNRTPDRMATVGWF